MNRRDFAKRAEREMGIDRNMATASVSRVSLVKGNWDGYNLVYHCPVV